MADAAGRVPDAGVLMAAVLLQVATHMPVEPEAARAEPRIGSADMGPAWSCLAGLATQSEVSPQLPAAPVSTILP